MRCFFQIKIILILISVLLSLLQACGSPIRVDTTKVKNSGNFKGVVYHPVKFAIPSFKDTKTSVEAYYLNPKITVKKNDFNQELSTAIGLIENANKSNPVELEVEIKKLDLSKAKQTLNEFQIKEYYKIGFHSEKITINAHHQRGCFNALGSLLYLIKSENSQSHHYKEIEDWPDIRKRILQINLKAMHPDVLKKVVERAWLAHYNGLMLYSHSSVLFEAQKPYCDKFAMSTTSYKEIVEYGRELGMEVIPQLNFLSHQSSVFIRANESSNLLYNRETINPNNPKALAIIESVIHEIDSLIKPKYFQIGFDEVLGHKVEQTNKHGPMLPANLYLKQLRNVYSILLERNIKTWIWGDMLLKRSDFPLMHQGSLHANEEYAKLIDSIPRDIVICDWHYREYKKRKLRHYDYSSLNYFTSEGFRTYGATYEDIKTIRAFSKSTFENKSNLVRGMIATTWHKLLKGTIDHLNSDNLESFDEILSNSAEAFWNASKIKGPPYSSPKK